MNKVLLPIGIIPCLLASVCVRAAVDLPPAERLLEDVRARLPQNPLLIKGELKVRKRKGIVVKTFGFKSFLHLDFRRPVAVYTIRDGNGKRLEELSVERNSAGMASYRYINGDSEGVSKTPPLFSPVQGTDLSWADLTLSFLWWREGRTVGEDTVKGRQCYVVEVIPPDNALRPGGEEGDRPVYKKVKLWVDRKLRMILQAEGYGRDGEIMRRLWIRSLKKVDDQWMIKQMEVASFPALYRTRLCIGEVEAAADYDFDSGN
ncbi:MAG: outer membrane lipoprotein-sorting protein [Kiritimatiellia bacterium]